MKVWLRHWAKVASHERVIERRRRMLASQQTATLDKSPSPRDTDDLLSRNDKAAIKEAMVFLSDAIERHEEEEKQKLLSINEDDLPKARKKLEHTEREL